MNANVSSIYRQIIAILLAACCVATTGCSTMRGAVQQSAATTTTSEMHEATPASAGIAYEDTNISVDDTGASAIDDEHCMPALYWADEPLSSQMQQTSAADLEQMCADAQIECMRRCMNNPKPPYPALKKGDRAHFALCHKRCFNQFMECMRKAGLLEEFSVLDTAMAWMKTHGKEIVGTVVLIGGVAYVVSTAGSGALVLALL